MASDPDIAPEAAPADAPATGGPPARLHSVDSIAGQVRHLPNGHRAQLRRIYLTERYAAEGIVIGLLHRAGVPAPRDEEGFRPWRLLAHAAAILAGTGEVGAPPHSNTRQLGTALEAAGYSENRLLRLTSARGAGLDAQVVRALSTLANGEPQPVNLRTLFDLVGNDADRAEAARLRLARDYYTAVARSEKGDDK